MTDGVQVPAEQLPMQRAAATAKPVFGVPERVVFEDGTVLNLIANAAPLLGQDGTPYGAVAAILDVTERKQTEEALRENRGQLAGIISSAMDAIITVDIEEHIRSFNEAAERMFGCPAEDALGQRVERFIPMQFRAQHSEHIRRFGESGVSSRAMGALGELAALRVNGEEFPIEASISAIQVGGKKLFTVILRDITERKRAEKVVRESEERFRLVANTAPVLIWMAGTDKLCNYFNQTWLEFTGRPVDAELGNGWAEGVHPDDLRRCLDIYTQAFDRREKLKMEYRLRRHDGQYRWILDIGVPRFNADKSFAGYIGSCIDITDRKQAEAALSSVSRRLIEAQEQERSRIARELHDDINQRIALLAIELRSFEQNPSASAAELHRRVKEAQNRVSDLGRDIQALSHRLHSSKLEYLGLPAAAASFCRELCEQQKVEINFTGDGIPRRVPPEISLCLFRVLQEALQNAVKHSGVKRFKVELRAAANEIHLAVSDSGVGFNPAAAIEGSGLGLISMQERLQLVEGELSIESAPNRGTTLRARVPLTLGEHAMESTGLSDKMSLHG
jgi:PAS domain S-box-containing protein